MIIHNGAFLLQRIAKYLNLEYFTIKTYITTTYQFDKPFAG